MNVSLVEAVGNQLTDVVVINYGTQKKVDVTGAISSVKDEALKQSPTANLSNSIAGRIPGVILNNRSGEPGQDASEILIRGKGTLNDNSPLIVIDGVANRGDFDRLNPDDIESITVLKDASAAIYGAQAANGVILVTTKRGKIGEPVITYNGSYGLTQPTRLPKLINSWQFATYKNELNNRLGIPPQFSEEEYLLQFNPDGGYYFGAASDRVPGLSLGVVPNPNVTWEIADSKNIGIESSFWNGAFDLNADYFISKRSNILLPRNASIPTSTGLNSSNLPDENIGKVNNRGYECPFLTRVKSIIIFHTIWDSILRTLRMK